MAKTTIRALVKAYRDAQTAQTQAFEASKKASTDLSLAKYDLIRSLSGLDGAGVVIDGCVYRAQRHDDNKTWFELAVTRLNPEASADEPIDLPERTDDDMPF